MFVPYILIWECGKDWGIYHTVKTFSDFSCGWMIVLVRAGSGVGIPISRRLSWLSFSLKKKETISEPYQVLFMYSERYKSLESTHQILSPLFLSLVFCRGSILRKSWLTAVLKCYVLSEPLPRPQFTHWLKNCVEESLKSHLFMCYVAR